MDFATSSHPGVQAQLDRLGPIGSHGDRLGLDRIGALLDRLERPQDALPPVLHVAGTNGKGSTCAFLRAALEAAGYKAHLFTSPHLVRFNERIRIAGELIADEQLAGLLEQVIGAAHGFDASFFEVTTAAALLAFARTPADACILEVGLGGRLDATNIIKRPLVCGIAGLGIDHRQYLGDRLIDIAGEKAGIAKARVPLVTQRYHPAIATRIKEIAVRAGAPWMPRGGAWNATVARDRLRYRDSQGELALPCPRLAGRHQAMNAALAIAMLRHQPRLRVDDSAFEAAMGDASWPARLQRLAPGPLTGSRADVWLDGGHNASAARAVAAFARRQFGKREPLHLLFASLSSKDPKAMLAPFVGIAGEVHCLPVKGHDCRDPQDLAALAASLGFRATAHSTLEQALSAVPKHAPALVFGSLYLAGEVLAANDQPPD